MRRVVTALFLLLAAVAVSQPGPQRAAAQDHDGVRVIHITVDSLHPEEVDATTPFLNQLKNSGTWYTQARAIMGSETLPNHVAMATGAYGGPNGITGNGGRLAPGDRREVDPDLGVPRARQTRSLFQAIETSCPDLRTVGVMSKSYVWRTFSADPVDSYFHQPNFNVPVSEHAPDASTAAYILGEIATGDVDYLFANLGDVDRVGHLDASSILSEFTDLLDLDLLDPSDTALLRKAILVQTDALIGTIVTALQAADMWDDTVLIVASDHSMVWTNPLDQSRYVDVQAALDSHPATAGRFFTAENGGTANVYLFDPSADDADQVLAEARSVLDGLPGLVEALYRLPNPLDPGHDLATVRPDWQVHQTHTAGEIFVHVDADHVVGSLTSNPLPGNHGHGATRHATALISGGWDGVAAQIVEASDPAAIDPIDDTAALPEQAEQVDYAPTIGWLMGIPDPGGAQPQWQGRVLAEAFDRQPTPVCVEAPDEAAPPETVETSPGPTEDAGPVDTGRDLPATGGDTGLLVAVAAAAAAAVLWLGRRQVR